MKFASAINYQISETRVEAFDVSTPTKIPRPLQGRLNGEPTLRPQVRSARGAEGPIRRLVQPAAGTKPLIKDQEQAQTSCLKAQPLPVQGCRYLFEFPPDKLSYRGCWEMKPVRATARDY